MQSVLSLLTGVVLIGLVYGLSFLPTATLAQFDDIEVSDEEDVTPDSGDAGAPSGRDASTDGTD